MGVLKKMVKKRAGRPARLTIKRAVEYVDAGKGVVKPGQIEWLIERKLLPLAPGDGWRRVYLADLDDMKRAVVRDEWDQYYAGLLKRAKAQMPSPGPVPGKPKIEAAFVYRWYPRHCIVTTTRAEDVIYLDEGIVGDPVAVLVPDSGMAHPAIDGGPGFGAKHALLPYDTEETRSWLALCWQDELVQDDYRSLDSADGPRRYPDDFDHLFSLGYLQTKKVVIRHTHPLYDQVRSLMRSRMSGEGRNNVYPDLDPDYDPFNQ